MKNKDNSGNDIDVHSMRKIYEEDPSSKKQDIFLEIDDVNILGNNLENKNENIQKYRLFTRVTCDIFH